MKRAVILLLSAVICCFTCACDPGGYIIDREELNDVVSVELIEYKNEEQKHFASWVSDKFDQLVPFELDNATVIETLPEEKNDEFLDAFSSTDILHTYYAYNSPKDVCLRLNYENGDFLIIWANYAENSYAGYIGEYSSDGAVISFWGSFSSPDYYTDLVNDYFNYTLE
ncbi:MAG: hypothetical protein IJO64_08125 [Clostridia bacterium]|nr:hypothetical protein [Clostridia bacterium]